MVEPLTDNDPREIGGYQLRARLGAGGMGRVYLAFTRGGRPVAIKVVRGEFGDDEEFRDRFRQEVIAAQRVHGLYTAQVLYADPDARQPWLATAYVPGMSLQQAVSDHGPLPADTVFLLMAGIAEALQAIHEAGVVHRDLKPSNVILAADGPKVIDFGIARAVAAPSLTRSGILIGSPRFMAPEQARGQLVTPKADVFALGSVATYAATSRPPFGTGTAVTVLHRALNEAPDLEGCPADLRPLIQDCLAKDPAQRPEPSQIIDACRARTAGGVLAFGPSWLPPAVAAAAAGDAAAALAPLIPGLRRRLIDTDGTDSGVSSETSYPGQADADEDTFSGASNYPVPGLVAGDGIAASGAGPLGPGAAAPPAGAVPNGGAANGGAANGGAANGGAANGGAANGGAANGGAANGGAAGPEAAAATAMATAGAAAGPDARVPGPAGSPSSAGPAGEQPGGHRRVRTSVLAGAAAVLLLGSGTAATIALTGRPGHPAASHSSAPVAVAEPGTHADPTVSAAPHLRRTGHRAPGPSPESGRADPRPTVTQAPPAVVPGPRSSSATSPGQPKPSSPAPPSGQALYAGTWTGTVSQLRWPVSSWTIQLIIPASGDSGSYTSPSQGCTGYLVLSPPSGGTMDATAVATGPVGAGTGCTKQADLVLTLAGGQMDLSYTPAKFPRAAGSATLAKA